MGSSFKKTWLALFYFCLTAAITAPWIEGAASAHFDPLLRLFFIVFSVLIVFVLPWLAFFILLRSAGGYNTFMALSLGSALTFAALSIWEFWALRLFGFGFRSVCLQLLVLSLVVFLFGRRKKFSSSERFFSASWQAYLFWTMLAIFILMVLYPFIGTGEIRPDGVVFPKPGDWLTTGACITSVVSTGIPPANPFVASKPLIYYYLYHIYSALLVWSSYMRVGNIEAGVWVSLLGAATCFCVFFGILKEWLRSYGGALLSTLLITVFGGYDCVGNFLLWYFKGEWPHNIDHWTSWTVFRVVNPLVVFYWMPVHAIGALFSFLLIYFLCRRFKGVTVLIMGVICVGAMLGFSSFVAAGGIFAVIAIIAFELMRLLIKHLDRAERGEAIKLIFKTAIVGIVGFLLVLPIYWKTLTHAVTPHAGNSIIREIRLPEVYAASWVPLDYCPPNLITHLFWLACIELGEFGPVLILGLAGIAMAGRLKDSFKRRALLVATAACFLWVNSIDMGGTNPGECSSKCVGIILWWLLAVWSGLAFRERHRFIESTSNLMKKFLPSSLPRLCVRRAVSAAAKSLFVLVLVISILTTLLGINLIGEVTGTPGMGGYPRFSLDDWMAYLFLREHTSRDARVQRGPDCHYPEMMIPAWGRRITPFSHVFAAREYMVSEDEIQRIRRELESAFTTKDGKESHRILKGYGVDYLIVGEDEIRRYGQDTKLKFDTSPSLFQKVWGMNRTSIYRLR
ncbi:MAG: hypothetical protein P9M00_11780 [Candidatus Tritonobacter lacicola]|nr:hypothetical protein [Candidatus Tritonobacter lacicola]